MPHIDLTAEQFQESVSERLRHGLPSAVLGRVSKGIATIAQELANDPREGNAMFAEHYARVSRELQLLSDAARAEETRIGTKTGKGVSIAPR